MKTPDYKLDGQSIPMVTASASRDANNSIHVSLVNTSPNDSIRVDCNLDGVTTSSVTGRLLTAPAINACNTFENPDLVKPAVWNEATLKDNRLHATLPPKSVVVLALQ